MKKLIYPLIILFSFTIIAQENNHEVLNMSISGSLKSFDSRPKGVVGSVYINESFLPAKLSNSDKTYATRFNVYQDEMEVKKDGKDYSLPKTYDYSVKFVASNKIYRVYKYDFEGSERNGFFVVLVDGNKISLLLKERIILQDEVIPKTGYEKHKPPTLKHIKDKNYVGFKNNTTEELPSKKKEFYKLFSSKAGDIKKYMESNKLGVKKSEDLIKIFNYYNSLK